ncbi:MAG: hypothetical protein AB7O04_02035 [Hyphomonadaceae bacterium]
MVVSIQPSTTQPSALGLGVERAARESLRANDEGARSSAADSVSQGLGGQLAELRAARESVRAGLANLDLSLAAGREAANLVAQAADAARAGDDAAFQTLLQKLDETTKSAIANGAGLLAGASLSVQAEGGAQALDVEGLDLRLGAQAGPNMMLTTASNAADAEAAATAQGAAQDSLTRIQAGLERLRAAAQRLEAHDGFLAVLEKGAAANVQPDLDADAARLLALQVRQGLGQTGGSIANTQPDSVLGLFRA